MINFEIKQVFSGNHSKIEIPLKHDKNREFSQEIRRKGESLPLKSSGWERMYFSELISFNQFNQFL